MWVKGIEASSFRILLLSLVLIVTVSGILTVQAEEKDAGVAVVVNEGIKANEITADDIEGIFLNKKSKLGGDSVDIVTLKSGKMHESFLKTYVKKTDKQFESYWKKLVFTGKARMPKSFKDEKELLAYVSKTKGAIGYVAANSPLLKDAKVKVLTVKK